MRAPHVPHTPASCLADAPHDGQVVSDELLMRAVGRFYSFIGCSSSCRGPSCSSGGADRPSSSIPGSFVIAGRPPFTLPRSQQTCAILDSYTNATRTPGGSLKGADRVSPRSVIFWPARRADPGDAAKTSHRPGPVRTSARQYQRPLGHRAAIAPGQKQKPGSRQSRVRGHDALTGRLERHQAPSNQPISSPCSLSRIGPPSSSSMLLTSLMFFQSTLLSIFSVNLGSGLYQSMNMK